MGRNATPQTCLELPGVRDWEADEVECSRKRHRTAGCQTEPIGIQTEPDKRRNGWSELVYIPGSFELMSSK